MLVEQCNVVQNLFFTKQINIEQFGKFMFSCNRRGKTPDANAPSHLNKTFTMHFPYHDFASTIVIHITMLLSDKIGSDSLSSIAQYLHMCPSPSEIHQGRNQAGSIMRGFHMRGYSLSGA